jgi:hypothetical protein
MRWLTLSFRSFFLGLRFPQSHDPAQNRTAFLRSARRATRSLPDIGPIVQLKKLRHQWRVLSQLNGTKLLMVRLKSKKIFQSRYDLTISLAIYLRMLEMNLVHASVDGFINVVLTRVSWSRRRCFVEENEETVIGAFLSALARS